MLGAGVVANNLARRQPAGSAATEEVIRGCIVQREGGRDEPVEVVKPEKRRPRQLASQLRTHQSAHEVVDAPKQLRPGPSDRTRRDLLEAAEEVAVTAARVASEVIRTGMHLLQERGLRVHDSPFAQHSVNLTDHLMRIEHVLENGLYDHSIDALVCERYLVCVGDELNHRGAADIEGDDAQPPIGVERIDTVADRTAADDEDERG